MSEHPPLYFGISARLQGKREFGGSIGRVEAEEQIKEMCHFIFTDSIYRDDNKIRWREWCASHPNDDAAKFVIEFLE